MKQANRRLSSIQGLRAVAVGLVVLLHIHDNEARASADPILSEWLRHGAGGVDLFFVISGFVMVWISSGTRGLDYVGSFLFSRALRIYPLVWLFTSLAILGFVVAGTLDEWAASENRILFSYLLLPHELPPVLGVTWTVVHELYFYAAFALLLLFPARLLPFGLAAWTALVLTGSLSGGGAMGPWAAVVFNPLTFEFIAGALVAYAISSRKPQHPAIVLTIGAVLALVLPFLYGPELDQMTVWSRITIYGLPATLLVYGAAGLELTGRLSLPGWITLVGDMSYSLYLSHLLVIATLAHGWMRFAQPGPTDNLVAITAMAVAPAVFAAIVYFTLERPMVRMAHSARARLFGSRRTTALAAP